MKLIGITCMKEINHNNPSDTLYHNYCEAVVLAGGVPMIIPCLKDEKVLSMLINKLDGVIFSGGVDIDPALYGEMNKGSLDITKDRDDCESLVFKCCVSEKKPVLGICRGHQFINVMCGGTLFQDLSEIETNITHDKGIIHNMKISEGSFLYDLLGPECKVNSYHHQGVMKTGKGLKITGISEDGVIEAMEHETLPIVTVQFHPEKWMENENMCKVIKGWIDSIEGE